MQVPCPSFSLVTSASSPGQIARREARAPWSRLEREGQRGICSGFMQLQRGVVGRTRGGTQLQTGGAGWGSACGHALLSREYFLPIRSLLRRAGARSPVAVRDDVPAAAAALAAGNAECGISLHSRVRQAGFPVNHRLATAAIGSRFCACARIRSDFCIVGISFVRV